MPTFPTTEFAQVGLTQLSSEAMDDNDDAGADFVGAVGFFDAQYPSPQLERSQSLSGAAVGFFGALDAAAEKVLGFRQGAIVFESSAEFDLDDLASDLSLNGSYLTRLVVRDCGLKPSDVQVISWSLMKLHQLISLDFSKNPLGEKGVSILLDSCKGNVALAEIFLSCVGLNQAEDVQVFARILDDFPSLQTLDLSNNGLSSEALRVLGISISEHQCLEVLSLQKNSISVSNAICLVQCLVGNVVLHTLLLGEEARPNARSSNVKTLLKRAFKHEKDTLSKLLLSNFSLRNVSVDGLSSQELSRISTTLAQNKRLWEIRNGQAQNMSRADLARRGLVAIPVFLFSMVHISELDLSGNALEAVSDKLCSLKSLRWLSLADNLIKLSGIPFHLTSLKKLRHLIVNGNPFVSDLPKGMLIDDCSALLGWFSSFSLKMDLEMQVGALLCNFVSSAEVDLVRRLSSISRSSSQDSRGTGYNVRLFHVSSAGSVLGANKANLTNSASGFGQSPSERKSRRSSVQLKSPEQKRAEIGRKEDTPRSSASRQVGSLKAAAESSDTDSLLVATVRECKPEQLAVLSMFHPVIIMLISTDGEDWESKLRDSLNAVNNICKRSFIIVLTKVDARSGVVQSLLRRFARFGVKDVVPYSEIQSVFDSLVQVVNSAVEKFGERCVSRCYPAYISSLKVDVSSAPVVHFNSALVNQKAIEWGQTAGLVSCVIVDDIVCTSVDWAASCLEVLNEVDSAVIKDEEFRVLFPPEQFTGESRGVAVKLLQRAGVIFRIQDHWVVTQRLASAFPSQSRISSRTLAYTEGSGKAAGLICIRLFRMTGSVDSVSAVVKKLFFQAVGMFSAVHSVNASGFSGEMLLMDTRYQVSLDVENVNAVTLVLTAESDAAGQVIHMITTAIERVLDEEILEYDRLFQAADGSEVNLDKVVTEILMSDTRESLNTTMSSSIGKHLPLLPEILLLGTARVFWEELVIEKVIGQGSFGEISLATFRSKSKVAIKQLGKTETSLSLEKTHRLTLRELWVLSLLKHPNIVKLVGACFGPFAICMEFMNLGSLRDMLDCHPVRSWKFCRSLLRDISSAMEYAHSRQPPLVHSDLKSPNVLLCVENGTLLAKIADLGLASFTSLSATAAVDNPLWSAPEMIRHSLCSPSVDVYSFGIIMWEICSCEVPFKRDLKILGGFMSRLSEEIISGLRPSLTAMDVDVPTSMVELMKDCWSNDSAKRPSFREVVARLTHCKEALTDDSQNLILRDYLGFVSDSEPRATVFLGNSVVILRDDGHLALYDAFSLRFERMLQYKLSERVRMACAVKLDSDEVFFVYGGESCFALSESLACRNVRSGMSTLEYACCVDQSMWFIGRLRTSCGLQVWKRGCWATPPCPLSWRGQVVGMLHIESTREVWVVYLDRDGSVVCAYRDGIDSAPILCYSKTLTFRINSFCYVPWGGNGGEIWLASNMDLAALSVTSRETVRILRNDRVRVPLPLPQHQLVFCIIDGIQSLMDSEGKIRFSQNGPGYQVVLNDACAPVLLEDVIIVGARSGLCSWVIDERLSYVGHSSSVVKKKTLSSDKSLQVPTLELNSVTLKRSHNGGGNALKLSRQAPARAVITCDEHGKVVSANSAVEDMFGYAPHELVYSSCRNLFFLPRVKQRTGSILLYSARGPQRFSESNLWLSLMQDLLHVRIVNGQRKDGVQIPLFISSSEVVVGGVRLFALIFERIQSHCCVLGVDASGVISFASDNLLQIVGWMPVKAVGKVVNALIVTPGPETYLMPEGIDPWRVQEVSCKSPAGEKSTMSLQIIDFSHGIYTLLLSAGKHEMAKESVLNHYSVGEVLGVGMCGEVRKGAHKLTGTDVAIKRLKRAHFRDIGVNFSDRELRLMARLSHPNIVELFDAIVTEEEICLIMELLKGEELFAYCVRKGPLTEIETRKFFRDIVSAVDHMHRAEIVHRDLKLENCILMDSHTVKVIDLGLGCFVKNGPLSTACGSTNYAAPELFLSKRYFGPPVDVWAMGVTLFAMVCGQFPFESIQCSLDVDFEWPDTISISEDLKKLICGMFESNPDLRMTVEQIRRSEWINFGFAAVPSRTVAPPLRSDIILKMESELGMPMEVVLKSVKDRQINHFSATYKMLLRSSRSANNLATTESVERVIRKVEKEGLSLADIKQRRAGITRSVSGEVRKSPRVGAPLARRTSEKFSPKEVLGGAMQQAWVAKKPSTGIDQSTRFKDERASVVTLPQNPASPFQRNRLRTIADFAPVACLGRGGYGAVYLCREVGTSLVCAVKKICKEKCVADNQLQALIAEKDILKDARIKRSHWVAQLHYAFCDEAYLYLAMEFCAGGDLKTLMEHVSLEEDQVKLLGAEVVACVHYLHEQGYVHRDLKPANFMITATGHLKLIDFGLAKRALKTPISVSQPHSIGLRIFVENGEHKTVVVTEKMSAFECVKMLKWKLRLSTSEPYVLRCYNTKNGSYVRQLKAEDKVLNYAAERFRLKLEKDSSPGAGYSMPTLSTEVRVDSSQLLKSVVGTPNYMAKEVLEGEGYDAAVDWWSVGCMFFEMLCGYRPFEGSSPEEVLGQVMCSEPAKLNFAPSCSPDAVDLISKFLSPARNRLGSRNVTDITSHTFFHGVDWGRLHLQPPVFSPSLESETDCSYFEGVKPVSDFVEESSDTQNDGTDVQDWSWSANP